MELRSSYRLRSGERSTDPGGAYDGTYVEDYEFVEAAGDLDLCNGRVGPTPEYPDGTYYYVATQQWPYFSRFFVGPVAESFAMTSPGGARP